MKNYINPVTKEVYAYESDGSQDTYIKPGLMLISDADLAVLRAPTAADIERAGSDKAESEIADALSKALPLILAYIASKADAPAALKALAATMVTQQMKVKP